MTASQFLCYYHLGSYGVGWHYYTVNCLNVDTHLCGDLLSVSYEAAQGLFQDTSEHFQFYYEQMEY